MSVIQKIQDKYAKLMAVIIAIALVIFVIMLAFENGGSLFSGNTDVVGKVNGEKVKYRDFENMVAQQEAYMQQQGYGGEGLREQAIDAAWNQQVNLLVLSSEFDKLGLTVGEKELGDVLYGQNAPDDLKQSFTDSTGFFNAALAKQRIDQMMKSGSAEEKAQVHNYLNSLEKSRMNEKYNALIANSYNTPKWLLEKQNTDNSQVSNISFVREVYASIPDSSVKVSDSEIEEYISKHKNEFKQEENRSIAYVLFSAQPTAADSAEARNRIMELKTELDSTKDIKGFLASQGVQNYYDGYINGTRLQIPSKDSIIGTPTGAVFGPYLDGATYSVAKMIGKRAQPDTVKVRHILIALSQQDPQTGQSFPIRDTATAYKLADSIRTAIQKGSSFDSMVVLFSDDQGSKATGGVYENIPSGQMVPEFNDFIFGNPVGAKQIVKTDFGYHYVEVLSQKGSSMAYKIAYLNTPIAASNETDNNANNEATQFAGISRDPKSFDANVEKLKEKGIYKMIEPNITPNAYMLQGLGAISRPFVKKVYDADLGDVIGPERVGENYVVAIITAVNKKGTQSVAQARLMVEPLLRNHKKAEVIGKKIGTANTLEAVAAALGGKPIEVADSIRFSGASASVISSELKVVGAAFNAANNGKVSQPIAGNSGVYVIKINNLAATAVLDANVQEQRTNNYIQSKMRGVNPIAALREAADIKDDRSKIY